MMTIQELRNTLFEETKKRDFLYETTPANSQMLKEKCGGTFEAVLTENGDEKWLRGRCPWMTAPSLAKIFSSYKQKVLPLHHGKEKYPI